MDEQYLLGQVIQQLSEALGSLWDVDTEDEASERALQAAYQSLAKQIQSLTDHYMRKYYRDRYDADTNEIVGKLLSSIE